MKTRWKVLIIIGVLLVVIAAGITYVITNLDSIVKAAIEKYGSEAAKTAVRVSSVSIRLAEEKGEIIGLTVANPHGFSSPHVFRLGKIGVKIDARSVTSSPIVIEEIRISSPQVVYEMNQELASNILVLKKNIQESAAASKKETTAEKKSVGKEIKLRIKKLVMEQGNIEAHVTALSNKPQAVTLKHFEMTDVGGHDGATPSRIAEDILTALVEQVATDIYKAGLEKKVNKEVDRAVNRLLGR
jgi:hypothetical protein